MKICRTVHTKSFLLQIHLIQQTYLKTLLFTIFQNPIRLFRIYETFETKRALFGNEPNFFLFEVS